MKRDQQKRRPVPPRGPSPARPEEDTRGLVYGTHAAEAALANPARRIRRIRATENAANRLAPAIAARGLEVESVSPRDLDRLLGADTVHQGVLLDVEPLAEPELDALVRRAAAGAPLVVLDHVTDPHNVGAVLRSAAVFGAAGLVMTRRHSPPINATLAKAASGALELVPVLPVQNLAKLLEELKRQRFTIIGLDSEAQSLADDEAFTAPVAIVLGAEGKGLRQLTRETCTRLCRIATEPGALASLNVSNAAAVTLHLAAMRRRDRTLRADQG
jgi:23S rRNA (guanosine2251-2'-O)-methyltransferase